MTLDCGLEPLCHEAERNFRFSGAKTSKSLKKSRAARAMEMTSDHENQDFAADSGKVKTLPK